MIQEHGEHLRGGDDSRDTADRDPRLERLLVHVDPATARPRYWGGFHRTVMETVRFELRRRRREADRTVAETVTSWARTVIPSAMVAAAAAAAILLTAPTPTPTPVAEVDLGVEELLSAGLGGDPVPAELDEDPSNGLMFATAEIF